MNDNKIAILRVKNDDYFFRYIARRLHPLYFTKNLHLFEKLYQHHIIILSFWHFFVRHYNCFILFDAMLVDEVPNYIKKKNPKAKVIVYFWNRINQNNDYLLRNSNIDKFYTFDETDAKKYGIHFNETFYVPTLLPNSPVLYDAFFVGRAKERKKELIEVQHILEHSGCTVFFKIVEHEKDYISYSNYLKLLSQSKIIVDIVNNNQTGLTLRVMESLFYQKKLITNNKKVCEYPFYRANNIFIIDNDIKKKKIRAFLKKPYQPVPDDVLKNYTFEAWLNRFKREDIL